MQNKIPRILLSAPASGSGKTVAACALMSAFKLAGRKIGACKCGPDYIDPMFHKKVLGIDSLNLDLFFSKEEQLRDSFVRHMKGLDLAITEGVMGFYDGMQLDTEQSSSYDVACKLQMPVILVVPAHGTALSLAAVIQGMAQFRENSRIKGVLLNKVSSGLYKRMKAMLEKEFQKANLDISVVGYLPNDDSFHFESRHLGLTTPEELIGIKEQLERAGQIAAQTVDLEQIIKIANEAKELETDCLQRREEKEKEVRIAIAKDEAFCFYYKENLTVLEQEGCQLVPFSPLHDKKLPDNVGGILLGGGYPELYLPALSQNRMLQRQIAKFIQEGMPCIAECGGFMYLEEAIKGQDGEEYPFVGVISGKSYPTGKLVRFGYVEISLNEEMDSIYLKKGESIKGHEFHYWDSEMNGESCIAVKPDGKRRWECIHAKGTLFAGYPHLYYPSCPEFAKRFVQQCKIFAERKK